MPDNRYHPRLAYLAHPSDAPRQPLVNKVGAPVRFQSIPAAGLVTVPQVDRVLTHNLRQYRRQLGISQQALAERVQLNRANIGSYEEGRSQPPVATLVRLAKAFGVTLDGLLTPA